MWQAVEYGEILETSSLVPVLPEILLLENVKKLVS